MISTSIIPGTTEKIKENEYRMIESALYYAKNGCSVIPIRKKDKKPLTKWEQYQSARADEETIRSWWRRWPEANIGIVTGEASGIIVLDIDGLEGQQSIKTNRLATPPTPTVLTGGGGYHYYFKHPGFLCKNFTKKYPGIDFRGDGGYVLAPPSLHASGNRYEWIISPGDEELADPPAWLLDLIVKQEANGGRLEPSEWSVDIPQGKRNGELTRRAGSLLARGIPAGEVLTMLQAWNETHSKPPLPQGEVKTIVESISKKEQQKKRISIQQDFGHGLNWDGTPETEPETEPADGEGSSTPRFSGGYFDERGTFIPKFLADDLLINYSIKYAAGELWVYKDGVYKPDGENFLAKVAQRALKAYTRTNRIRETLDYIKRQVYTDLPEPNRDIINLKNGRLNWRTGELDEHHVGYFEIVQLPVTYNPATTCPVFDKYLATTLDEESAQLAIEILGYCLIPDTRFEKAFMFTGTGRNGKSIFLSVINSLLGSDNVSHIALQDLEENRFKAAGLLGKLVNTFADLDSRALKSTTFLKMLTSGDPIDAERKFKDGFSFTNYARMVFSANTLPRSSDTTFAFYERWIILPFERVFDANNPDTDPNLRDKLSDPRELSGIFNRALAGLQRLYQRGRFTMPESVKQALQEYERQNDSVLAFCDECTELKSDGFSSKEMFYAVYRSWCEEQGLKPVSQTKLKPRLLQARPGVSEGRDGNFGPRVWKGIQLTEDAPLPYVSSF
jgi:putative DNA primase/helicase